VIGAGFTHPRARDREAFVQNQLASLGPDAEVNWRTRR